MVTVAGTVAFLTSLLAKATSSAEVVLVFRVIVAVMALPFITAEAGNVIVGGKFTGIAI